MKNRLLIIVLIIVIIALGFLYFNIKKNGYTSIDEFVSNIENDDFGFSLIDKQGNVVSDIYNSIEYLKDDYYLVLNETGYKILKGNSEVFSLPLIKYVGFFVFNDFLYCSLPQDFKDEIGINKENEEVCFDVYDFDGKVISENKALPLTLFDSLRCDKNYDFLNLYAKVKMLQNNKLLCQRNNKYYLINDDKEIAVSRPVNKAYFYKNYIVYMTQTGDNEGKYLYDIKNKVEIPINPEDNTISDDYKTKYDYILNNPDCKECLSRFARAGEEHIVHSEEGMRVISITGEKCYVFNENEKCGVKNFENEIIIPADFDDIEFNYSEQKVLDYGTDCMIAEEELKMFVCKKDNLCSYYDTKGKLLFGNTIYRIEDVANFNNDLICVQDKDKYGYIDKTTKDVVIPIKFIRATPFFGDYAMVAVKK